jgi:hypothetical protein
MMIQSHELLEEVRMNRSLFLLGLAVIGVGCTQAAFATPPTTPELDMSTLTAMVSVISGSYVMYSAMKKRKSK